MLKEYNGSHYREYFPTRKDFEIQCLKDNEKWLEEATKAKNREEVNIAKHNIKILKDLIGINNEQTSSL